MDKDIIIEDENSNKDNKNKENSVDNQTSKKDDKDTKEIKKEIKEDKKDTNDEKIIIDMEEDKSSKDDNKNAKSDVSYKKKDKNKSGNNTGLVLIVSILLSFVCGMIGAYLICQTVSVEQVVKNITTSELVENSISSSVDKVYGSTVVVIASSKGKTISTGTGFIYKKKDGKAYIMTNNHVIDGADSVAVEFNDKNDTIDASIVGGDTYADIAVLTIKDDNYTSVEIGDVDSLKLGDTIFTVGSPMGFNYKGTVTKGILSVK